MFDFLSGKMELRVGLAALLLVSSAVFSFLGDQATFVRPPGNLLEIVLTIPPVLAYSVTNDRTICFVLSLGLYLTLMGSLGMGTLWFLERKVFEPRFFKKMIETKMREEKLFNRYLNELKP